MDVYEFLNKDGSPLSDNGSNNSSVYEFDDRYDDWNVNLPSAIKTRMDDESPFSSEKSLRVELVTRPAGWATINSPMTEANLFSTYTWEFAIRGENAYEVHAKVAAFNEKGDVVNTTYLNNVGSSTFDWKKISVSYVVSDPAIRDIQLQIWFGFETPTPLPNKIWLDDVRLVQTQYSRIDPSTYHMALLSDAPVTLLIDQTYDPLWQARTDNQIVSSEPVNEILNGFPISDVKSGKVVIKYGPQELFDILIFVSFSLTAVYLILFMYPSSLKYKSKVLALIRSISHW